MKRILCLWACQTALLSAATSLLAQNDRAVFELGGPVTRVVPHVIEMGDLWMTYEMEFSPEGTLQKIGGFYTVREGKTGDHELKRDESGRLVEASSTEGDGVRIIRYHYDDEGRVSGEDWLFENIDFDSEVQTGSVRFSYDDYGNKIRADIQYADESPSETITYSYDKFDDHGNWVSRTMNWPGKYESHTETRDIEYGETKPVLTEAPPVVEEPTEPEPVQGPMQESDSQSSRETWGWAEFLGLLLVLAIPFAICHILYVLLFEDRKIVPHTVEEFKQMRRLTGRPEDLPEEEENRIRRELAQVWLSFTQIETEDGTQVIPTNRKQIVAARKGLLACIESAPTDPDSVNEYNDCVEHYKACRKRSFTGSTFFIIISALVYVAIFFLAEHEWRILLFGSLNIAFYVFATLEPAFVYQTKLLKGKDMSKPGAMTRIMAGLLGFAVAGESYRIITKWSDGTTTTEDDHTGFFVQLLIGFALMIVVSYFMFVVSLINYLRNYVLYR
jgi:hypothetical protein